MRPCQHYEIWCKRIPRRALSPDGGDAYHEIKVPYCTHEHSPTPLEAAQHGLGEGAVLKCGGSVRRCPLPQEVRPQSGPRPRVLASLMEPWPGEAGAAKHGGEERE